MPLWPALLANAGVSLTFVLVPAFVPPLVDWYDVSLASGGWANTALNVPFAIIAFWLGLRAVRVRWGLLGGLGVLAIANGLAVIAPSYAWYLVSRFVAGAGMAITFAAAYTLVVTGVNVPRRIATYAAVTPVVSLVVPFAGFITDELGWQGAHIAIAAIPAFAFGLLLLRPWGRPIHTPRSGFTFGFSRPAWLGFLSVFLWASASVALFVFIGGYAQEVLYEGDPEGVATLTAIGIALNGLAGFFAASMVGRLSTRTRPRAGVAALIANIMIVLLFVVTGGPVPFLIVVTLWGGVYWVGYAVYQGMLTESVAPDAAGRVLTFYQVPYSVGLAAGPVVGGWVLGERNFTGAAFLAAALLLGAGIVFLGAWWGRLRSPTPTLTGGDASPGSAGGSRPG